MFNIQRSRLMSGSPASGYLWHQLFILKAKGRGAFSSSLSEKEGSNLPGATEGTLLNHNQYIRINDRKYTLHDTYGVNLANNLLSISVKEYK